MGDDGRVRASGLWLAPHSFLAMTLLHGRITGTTLSGTASNARCVPRSASIGSCRSRPGRTPDPSAVRTGARAASCCDPSSLKSWSIRNRPSSRTRRAVRPDPGAQPPPGVRGADLDGLGPGRLRVPRHRGFDAGRGWSCGREARLADPGPVFPPPALQEAARCCNRRVLARGGSRTTARCSAPTGPRAWRPRAAAISP